MTCIIALKTKEGHNVIAGDLMASNGHHFNKIKTSKIFTKGDQCIIGYTSSFRMGQILEFGWDMPPRIEGLTDEQYMCNNVMSSLRSAFHKQGFGGRDIIEDIGGTFLILYRDKLFMVQSNYSVLEYEDDVLAVGSGTDAALAVMHVLDTPSIDEIEEYLNNVFYAVAKVTPSVSEEYTYSIMEVHKPKEELIDLDSLDEGEDYSVVDNTNEPGFENTLVDSNYTIAIRNSTWNI